MPFFSLREFHPFTVSILHYYTRVLVSDEARPVLSRSRPLHCKETIDTVPYMYSSTWKSVILPLQNCSISTTPVRKYLHGTTAHT